METPVVVIVTRSRWDEPPRMRHQVATELARWFHVAYVETPATWYPKYRGVRAAVDARITRLRIGNQWALPGRLMLRTPAINGYINRRYVRQALNALAQQPGIVNRKLWLINFNFDAYAFMTDRRFERTIYVCNDDFASTVSSVGLKAAINAIEYRTAAAATHCITVSEPLRKKIQAANPRTSIMYPGHRCGAQLPRPELRCRVPPIRVGFVGYIDHRLNFGWLNRIANDDGFQLHLAGPILGNSAEKLPLERCVMHGTLESGRLNAFLSEMDVLTVPYDLRVDAVLAIAIPNKLFSYIAAEKPVVVSAMPHFAVRDEGVVYIARDADDFVACIRKAFVEDCAELRNIRARIAVANTWEARGQQLRELLLTLPAQPR